VVGLGNPGRKYEKTRHNVGWLALDELGLSFFEDNKFKASLAKDGKVLYCKPLTFMNNSGEAVRAVMDYYKIPAENITLVYDDKDLPLGMIRIRSAGSAAGHNGVASVIQHLGTDQVARIRIGIAGVSAISDTAHFVLHKFSRHERKLLEEIYPLAVKSIRQTVKEGVTPKQHRDLTIQLDK